MEEQKSFSQRVKETVIQCADLYKKCYEGSLEECDFDFCKKGQQNF